MVSPDGKGRVGLSTAPTSPVTMKTKNPAHSHRPLALLGIPFLLLSPAANGQDQDKIEKPAEVAENKETAEEKGRARLAKEVADREEEAARRAEQAARRAKEAAEKEEPAIQPRQKDEESPAPGKAPEPAPQPPAEMPDQPGKPDAPAKGKGREEADPATRKPTDQPTAPTAREAREHRERPAPPADEPADEPAEEGTPPIDMPVVPSEPIRPREVARPQGSDKIETPEPKPAAPGITAPPATETERLAETEVAQATREVQRELDQRKTRIGGRDEAEALINEILGSESRISRAEVAREERFRPRFERQYPGQERLPEASPDQRRAATTYLQERLRGREVEGPPPEFFLRNGRGGDRGNPRFEEGGVEQIQFARPRYLNEGRRYVHFDSRAAIPAILMAAQAMNQVRFQPTREIAPMFHERQEVSVRNAMPLPPESYRSADSWVVSYPVDENSMISREDILFLQGSTQFSNPYSYEVIGVMADAMKSMPGAERFVIEGHASAEGGYDSNMALSQQRAEHIVREIVRRGVSPYRLLPVGYGESEARHPDNAAEALRARDRRVVVFRMKQELAAAP